MQQEYEFYLTGAAGCDNEWQPLGKFSAASMAEAWEHAAQLWPVFSCEELAACTATATSRKPSRDLPARELQITAL